MLKALFVKEGEQLSAIVQNHRSSPIELLTGGATRCGGAHRVLRSKMELLLSERKLHWYQLLRYDHKRKVCTGWQSSRKKRGSQTKDDRHIYKVERAL